MFNKLSSSVRTVINYTKTSKITRREKYAEPLGE